MNLLSDLIILSLFISTSVVCHADPAHDPLETRFIQAFEGICLNNKDNFSHIEKMAASLSLKPIPDKIMQGDEVISRMGGKGYIYSESGHKFLIAYATQGGCSIASPEVDVNKIKSLLLSNYNLNKMKYVNEGMQITDFYRFKKNSKYEDDIVTVTYIKDGQIGSPISVSFVPWKAFLKFYGQN